MGQTLTHGVYLPDEGERNCYAGLAANWQILDSSVGTIAAHTSALSGKAPLVHTHTKSDITDFPAYGNAAGTICEGNDSRLSDARTPVAHTHGKSDVTNLLNSDFIPSANNAYDLGSSSYQWNNLYAKNYYYNGVAWGLDKVNTWTAQQKIVGNNARGTVSIYNSTYTKGSALSSTDLSICSIYMGDGGQQGLANSLTFISTDLAANGAKTLLSLSAMENTASSGTRTNVVIQYDKNDAENPKKVSVWGTVQPNPDATFSLGTSSFRWKTLNGINPGALSLPDVTDGDPISTVGWSLTGARNTYTPTENGWFFIRVKGTASAKCSLNIHSGSYNDNYPTWVSYNDPTISLSTSLVVPAQKTVNLYVYIIAAEIEQLIFYPALGNV